MTDKATQKKPKKFRLSFASFAKPGNKAQDYFGLDLYYSKKKDNGYSEYVDYVDEFLGLSEMPYGPLHAYLFRRFGYPNTGWDDYKQLAKYILSTPMPDMIMSVIPCLSGSPGRQVSFMVPYEKMLEVNHWPHRAENAWHDSLVEWVQSSQPTPDWMPSFIDKVGKDGWEPTFANAFKVCVFYHDSDQGTNEGKAYHWHKEMTERYSAEKGPCPPCKKRHPDWTAWDDGDPLKPYMAAAREAAMDLLTPVSVRDQAINALGIVEGPRAIKAIEPAPSAGYPSGKLGNTDPEGFADLCGLVIRLGGGNNKKGIKKAAAILASAIGKGETKAKTTGQNAKIAKADNVESDTENDGADDGLRP